MMQPDIALNPNNAIPTRNRADSIGALRSKTSGQSERSGFSSVLDQTSPCNRPKPSSPAPRGPKPQHAEARPQPQRDENRTETSPEPDHSSPMVATGQSASAQSHGDHADGTDDAKSQPDQNSEETDALLSDDSLYSTGVLVTMSPPTNTVDHEACAIATAQSTEDSSDALPAMAPAISSSAESTAALPSPEEGQALTPGLSKPEAPHATASSPQSRQMVNPPQAPSTEQIVETADRTAGGDHEADSPPSTDSLLLREGTVSPTRGEATPSTHFVAADPPGLRIARTGIDQGTSTSPSSGGDAATATLFSPSYEWHEGDPTQSGEQNDRSELSAQTGKQPSIAPAGHADHGFGETVLAFTDAPKTMDEGSAKPSSSNMSPSRGGQALTEWPKAEGHPQFLQSISLDLEPADLGPVNVRIFMTDRTVHAHIRTDHADLGQGMLNQQHTLESSLQDSGLEMGQFKVTIDQHGHHRGDSHGLMRQQADWRQPAGEPGGDAENDQEHRVSSDPYRRSGIMSIFA